MSSTSRTKPDRVLGGNRAKVDEVGWALAAVGARNVEGPMLCVDYSEDYYAIFFEDPSDNRFEVVHRTK